ncbi:uncharacterized protein LOC135324485 [Dromaius novaehollandiae]|uniref:uncharacterized protein LOC135324485 n=1 Tax=Dromaius novaehollandiae TaxID=8790 RepID=UPI00311FDD36
MLQCLHIVLRTVWDLFCGSVSAALAHPLGPYVIREDKQFGASSLGRKRAVWQNLPCALPLFCLLSAAVRLQTPESRRTSYSRFKNSIKKKLTARAPVASSPIVTRWQQLHMRSSTEELHGASQMTDISASGAPRLINAPGNTPVSSQVPNKLSVKKTVVTLASSHNVAGLEERNSSRAEMGKRQKCASQLLMVQEVGYSNAESGGMKVCENISCIWKECRKGLQNEFRAVTTMKPVIPLEPEVRLHVSGLRDDYCKLLFISVQSLLQRLGILMCVSRKMGRVCPCQIKWKPCVHWIYIYGQDRIKFFFFLNVLSPLSPTKTKKSTSFPHPVTYNFTAITFNSFVLDLNILDWNRENLIAIALGPAAHIWNGRTLQGIERIDLNSSSKYISSLAWIKEGTCLAIGTSDGEVQLWDIETKKRLRNMFGHLSVVGALSWNHYILSSGSRLGSIHHHDVRVAQHHVGTLCQNKQSICSLKWSLTNKLLASGSSDGILNIWPSDPGVKVQSQPLKTLPHSSGVKAMNWCPWQSKILATGGGMKDGILRVWDINREKIIQSAATDSQICSLLWLPKTSELMTGQGLPRNQMVIWKYPMLINSSELYGHKGRVLHVALSPDESRLFSVAADGTACVWKCHESGESRHTGKAFSDGYLGSFL